MLYRVGDINLLARNARIGKRSIEHPACGTDEWMSLAIFDVTGLFADENDARVFGSFAEDRLRGSLVEITSLTRKRCGA